MGRIILIGIFIAFLYSFLHPIMVFGIDYYKEPRNFLVLVCQICFLIFVVLGPMIIGNDKNKDNS